MVKMIWKLFFFCVFVFFVAIVTILFIASPIQIRGNSMEPLFPNSATCISNKILYNILDPKRQDVVYYFKPSEIVQTTPQIGKILGLYNGVPYIGRIVGLPGENLTITAGRIYINGANLTEPYITEGTQTIVRGNFLSSQQFPLTISQNTYFILTDRRKGADSGDFGFVPRENIISRVEYCW